MIIYHHAHYNPLHTNDMLVKILSDESVRWQIYVSNVAFFNTVQLFPKYLTPYSKHCSTYWDLNFHWHYCTSWIFQCPFFNPINLYTLIGYNGIINQNNKRSPIVQNILYWNIMYPFKAKDSISRYISYHLKSCQPQSNFLILTYIPPCKPLVEISALWFSESVFQLNIPFQRVAWTNDIW